MCIATPADARPSHPDAVEAFNEGQRLYKAEEYAEAAEQFEKGYEIEADLALLYAWAQAERLRGRCGKALKLYRKFLESNPPAEAVESAERGMVLCAEEISDDPSTSAGGDAGAAVEESGDLEDPVDEPTEPFDDAGGEDKDPPPNRDAWYRDPLGGTLVAVGAVGTGVGVGLLVAGAVEAREEAGDYGEFEQRQERVRKLFIAGGVVTGVGAALLIGGAIRWGVLGARQRRNGKVGVMHGRGLAGLTWSGKF